MSEVLTVWMILSGCTHTDVDTPKLVPEMNSVNVMLLQEPSTRSGIAPQAHVGNGAAVSVSNGYLYFTDSNGNILLYRKIDKSAPVSEGNVISLDQLQSTGAIVEKTPNNAAYCYIFLNLPASGFSDSQMAKVSGPISSIEGLTVSTNDLYDAANGGVGKVPLWGRGTIAATTSNSMYGAEVKVSMRVIASRVEIAKISTVPSVEMLAEDYRPYEITDFKVAGIFVNNFFPASRLNGWVVSGSQVYNEAKEVFAGPEDAPNTPYINYIEMFTYSNALSGIAHNSTDAPGVFSPPLKTGQDVWAYNLFPNDTSGVNTAAYLPHIIIRFSQLTYRPQGSSGQGVTMNDQFITIRGFMSNGVVLQHLRKGLVYYFANLPFSLDNVSPVPEAKMIAVDVSVSILPWIVEGITPVL